MKLHDPIHVSLMKINKNACSPENRKLATDYVIPKNTSFGRCCINLYYLIPLGIDQGQATIINYFRRKKKTQKKKKTQYNL
jgi:hypothetical protein